MTFSTIKTLKLMSLGNSKEEEFFATVAAIIAFLGCFIYAISTYGLLLGGGLG